MKRYNRDARASHKHIHAPTVHATRATHATPAASVHIRPRYGGYTDATYMRVITRETHTRTPSRYVREHNAMVAIHTLDDASTARVAHLPHAPYRQFAPTPPTPPLTRPTPPPPTPIADTARIKAVIYDSTGTRRIWYGIIRRTRTVTITPDGGSVTITLHRNTRTLDVTPYLPPSHLLPYTRAELDKYHVETYKLP